MSTTIIVLSEADRRVQAAARRPDLFHALFLVDPMVSTIIILYQVLMSVSPALRARMA